MKLYKFRDLSLKDQMRIEVDFGGEPVEIDEEKIEEVLYKFSSSQKDIGESLYLDIAKAIKQLLT